MSEPAGPSSVPEFASLADRRRIDHARRLLDRARSEAIDRLARLAALLLGTPYGQVSILTDRQVVAGLYGLELDGAERESPLEASLCTITARSGAPLLVDDAPADARVAELPPVTSGLVGSYLGAPVITGGDIVGAVCVFGPDPRAWTDHEVRVLSAIAEAVATELELSGLAADAVQTAVRLDLGFAAANIGSFDWNLVTDELHWDDRLRELFGYGADFVAHIDSFYARLHPDDHERTSAAIREAVASCGEYDTEYRVILPGGATRWVAARGRVLCGTDGRPERMLGAAYDTTATHDAGERVARLLETMSSAFFSLDPQWRFTYVNRHAETLLARGRDELLGRELWEAFGAARGTLFEERYRHAARTGEPVAFEAFYAPLGAWYEVRAWPGADGLSVFFHEISERVAAEEERSRAHERLVLLSDAGSRLSATLEVSEVLDVLSDLVLARFGAWIAVAVRDDVAALLAEREDGQDDELRFVHFAAASRDAARALTDALTDLHVPVGRGVAAQDEVERAVRETLVRASVPGDGLLSRALVSRDRVIGALVAGDPSHAGDDDRELLGELATRAAVALDNAVLYGAERRAATALQHALLPSELPQLPGIRTAARYIAGTAGREVGGDFYIGQVLDDGRIVLAIGDVMGHGAQAAARMGQLRAVLTAYAFDGDDPGVVLSRVARRADDLLDVQMATVCLLVYDPVARMLTAASAGHPPPLLAPLDAPPAFLELRHGPPIGVGPVTYATRSLELPGGATLVLYTDGLVENRDEPIDAGLGRLRDALVDCRMPPEKVCDHVLERMGRTTGATDDVALVVLSHA